MKVNSILTHRLHFYNKCKENAIHFRDQRHNQRMTRRSPTGLTSYRGLYSRQPSKSKIITTSNIYTLKPLQVTICDLLVVYQESGQWQYRSWQIAPLDSKLREWLSSEKWISFLCNTYTYAYNKKHKTFGGLKFVRQLWTKKKSMRWVFKPIGLVGEGKWPLPWRPGSR